MRIIISNFAKVMESKIRKNSWKSNWKTCNVEYLLRRLDEEAVELHKAVEGKKSYDEILKEAADVANLAMMIADRDKP